MRFTILTPAYNRAYTLTRLYESLQRQTFRDFEWLVVDDGSKDNTEQLIQSFIDEKPFFDIVYIKTENGGKHRAINRGLPHAKGELTFLLDSDDWLTDDGLQLVDEMEKTIEDKQAFIGVLGLRVHEDKGLIGRTFDGEYVDCRYMERTKYNITGDKAEVFYTHLLQKYPFPEFDGEKFATERLVWNQMSKDGYKIRYFNKPVQYCEYLEDGLTAGGYAMYAKYPKQWGLAIWQDYHYGEKSFKSWYHNTQQVYVFYLFTKDTLSKKQMAQCLQCKRGQLSRWIALQKMMDAVRFVLHKGVTMKKSAKGNKK